MTEAICWPILQEDCLKLQKIQQLVTNRNARILEIGAGIGVVGIALAAMGGHVLQTDLSTLVDNAIYPNQQLNKNDNITTQNSDGCCPPKFLQPYSSS